MKMQEIRELQMRLNKLVCGMGSLSDYQFVVKRLPFITFHQHNCSKKKASKFTEKGTKNFSAYVDADGNVKYY